MYATISSLKLNIEPLYVRIVNTEKPKLYGPFLWMLFNCLKAADALQGGLLFKTKEAMILTNDGISFYGIFCRFS